MNGVGDAIGDAARTGEESIGAQADDVLVLDEFVLPVWEPTGQPEVDAALDHLSALDPDDPGSQAEVFDRVHRQLRQVLADLDG